MVTDKVLPHPQLPRYPREKMEQLLNLALVSPFFLTLAIFTVAIVFAPPVKNEIALVTEQEHEEMDHARSSSPEMVAVPAPGLESGRDGKWTKINMKSKRWTKGQFRSAI